MAANHQSAGRSLQNGGAPLPLLGKRANQSSEFLLWQLADSAFPTGGFAHSGGLEAAWQQGEVRNRVELREWLLSSLRQISQAALPFVNAAHTQPERLEELDRLCDAFTSNHVANRASRLQGRALMSAAERVFKAGPASSQSKALPASGGAGWKPALLYAHLAPTFGTVTRYLGVAHHPAVRLYVFTHLRGVIAAAVRLNIVGPMEGQAIQFQLSGLAEAVARHGLARTLDDLAQSAPLLDVWQGAQDRLYSRLFQS
jgi:urease accessory protein